jgi:hypothetical protein
MPKNTSAIPATSILKTPKPIYDFADGDAIKSGLGGEHIDSNHRLMYTWACASPQKWRAPGAFAPFGFHLSTVSSASLHWITNQ